MDIKSNWGIPLLLLPTRLVGAAILVVECEKVGWLKIFPPIFDMDWDGLKMTVWRKHRNLVTLFGQGPNFTKREKNSSPILL